VTPFSWLARRLSGSLEEVGYRPLDQFDGLIGGDRHGVYDHTWVSLNSDGRHCFTSLFITPEFNGALSPAEVWAAVENGADSPRSLVLHFSNIVGDPDAEVETRLRLALLEGVRRAEQMRTALDAEYLAERPEAARTIERAPYQLTVAAVRAVFESEPEREWRNRDVLEALLGQEFMTDRAAVNAALADLAWRGVIERIRRGRYRARSPRD
jgi:hypothetical protein